MRNILYPGETRVGKNGTRNEREDKAGVRVGTVADVSLSARERLEL